MQRVSGGIILAPEGINGSICGTRESVEKVFATLLRDTRFRDLRRNEAPATEEEEELHHGHTAKSPLGAGDDAPFRWGHVRVKLKNEVIKLPPSLWTPVSLLHVCFGDGIDVGEDSSGHRTQSQMRSGLDALLGDGR